MTERLILGTCGVELPGGAMCPGNLHVIEHDDPIWTVQCDLCGFEGGMSARKADPKLRQQARLSSAGLPARFVGVTVETTDGNRLALQALRQWLAGYNRGDLASLLPAPALWGLQGRGKSVILTALCVRIVVELDRPVRFRSSRALLREFQQFENPQARGEAWDRAAKVDVLALDDLGAEQVTDWRQDQIADLVDARYESELPIVLATNYPPSMWEQRLDVRTVSRLRGMTFPVELRGPDRRQTELTEGESGG